MIKGKVILNGEGVTTKIEITNHNMMVDHMDGVGMHVNNIIVVNTGLARVTCM
jgi:hypothetical protein